MSKENTAVFIGHNECYGVTSEQIKEAIVSLIDKGVTEFLSGGQGGFDRLCGRCVYELKKEYSSVNICFYLLQSPHRTEVRKWFLRSFHPVTLSGQEKVQR